MCEINFIKPIKSKVQQEDIKSLESMLLSSSEDNKDGFGIFSDKGFYKSADKFTSSKTQTKEIKKLFLKSNFIIGHNRFATTGKVKIINSHPFSNSRFIWIHNGIIDNKNDIEKRLNQKYNVDSEVIGNLILDYCKEYDIIKALKYAIEELKGSFSVFIYDKKENRLYYFKHEAIFCFKLIKIGNRKIIIGSTEYDNMNNIYSNNTKTEFGVFDKYDYVNLGEFIPTEDIVYEIDLKTSDFKKVCEFEIYVSGFWKTEDYDKIDYSNIAYRLEDYEIMLRNYFIDETLTIKKINDKEIEIKGKPHSVSNIADYFNKKYDGISKLVVDYDEFTWYIDGIADDFDDYLYKDDDY